MPRIRSLKPEHKTHRKIGPLTDRQYRLWVGMLTEADDEGRLVADPAQLRLQVFGYHPRVRLEHVVEALQVLFDAHLIDLYTLDGIQYAAFPSWHDHQVINKRRASKLPSPLQSRNDTGALPEYSGMTPVGSRSDQGSDLIKDQGSEGIKEGKGVRGEGNQDVAVATGSDRPAHPTKEQQLEALARSNGTTADDLLRAGWKAAKR